MSPIFERRRESFVDSVAAFSPSEALWSGYQYGGEQASTYQPSSTAHGLPEHRHTTYQDAASVQYSQPAAWHLKGTSGSCTPTAVYDGLNTEYEVARTAAYTVGPGHSTPAGTYVGLQVNTGSTFSSHPTYGASPQSAKDWMSASSSEGLEYRAVTARNSPHSPSFTANTILLRRDGIRKKNARFEIPAERNLRTIDMLINQTNDEHEIKELKQQKRLLRNRQAALDSRQRKKQHTERLEEEKKHYTTIINELEEALGEMKLHEAEWAREKEDWATSQQQLKQYVDNLLIEKEELVRCHTIETGELRKRNATLSEQIQRIESTAMSTAPSSTGFSADFSDFDHLTMDSSPWDNFSLANDFSIETDNAMANSMMIEAKRSKPAVKEDDKIAASGFLLMLLLCGAWVASRGPTTPSNVLPTMSDDMRVASATVLNNIYKDAGVQLQEMPCATQQAVEAIASKPRHSRERKTTLSALEIASLSNAPLETLHHQLTAPSEEQLRDQALSLSSIQYNELSLDGGHDQQHAPKYHIRRNIADALAAVRGAQEGSAAEIYTRSILWDKVPKDVVRDFARLVAESSTGTQGSWKSEPLS